MGLYDLPGDVEAQSVPLPGAVHLVAGFKQVLLVMRGNTFTPVGNRNTHLMAMCDPLDSHRVRRTVFDAVVQHIAQNTLQCSLVTPDRRQRWLQDQIKPILRCSSR